MAGTIMRLVGHFPREKNVMPSLLCSRVGPGMRDSERTVEVRDIHGQREFLRVPLSDHGRQGFVGNSRLSGDLPCSAGWGLAE